MYRRALPRERRRTSARLSSSSQHNPSRDTHRVEQHYPPNGSLAPREPTSRATSISEGTSARDSSPSGLQETTPKALLWRGEAPLGPSPPRPFYPHDYPACHGHSQPSHPCAYASVEYPQYSHYGYPRGHPLVSSRFAFGDRPKEKGEGTSSSSSSSSSDAERNEHKTARLHMGNHHGPKRQGRGGSNNPVYYPPLPLPPPPSMYQGHSYASGFGRSGIHPHELGRGHDKERRPYRGWETSRTDPKPYGAERAQPFSRKGLVEQPGHQKSSQSTYPSGPRRYSAERLWKDNYGGGYWHHFPPYPSGYSIHDSYTPPYSHYQRGYLPESEGGSSSSAKQVPGLSTDRGDEKMYLRPRKEVQAATENHPSRTGKTSTIKSMQGAVKSVTSRKLPAEKISVEKKRQGVKRQQSSKYKGVSWHKRDKAYVARVWWNGRSEHLGIFSCEIMAALAVDKRLLALHGPDAKNLNFPDATAREKIIKAMEEDPDKETAKSKPLGDAKSEIQTRDGYGARPKRKMLLDTGNSAINAKTKRQALENQRYGLRWLQRGARHVSQGTAPASTTSKRASMQRDITTSCLQAGVQQGLTTSERNRVILDSPRLPTAYVFDQNAMSSSGSDKFGEKLRATGGSTAQGSNTNSGNGSGSQSGGTGNGRGQRLGHSSEEKPPSGSYRTSNSSDGNGSSESSGPIARHKSRNPYDADSIQKDSAQATSGSNSSDYQSGYDGDSSNSSEDGPQQECKV